MKSPQEVAIDLLESSDEHRQWRFQKAIERRGRNKTARKLGYKNHADYVDDDHEPVDRQAQKFDHERGLRNG